MESLTLGAPCKTWIIRGLGRKSPWSQERFVTQRLISSGGWKEVVVVKTSHGENCGSRVGDIVGMLLLVAIGIRLHFDRSRYEE